MNELSVRHIRYMCQEILKRVKERKGETLRSNDR